MSVEAPSSTRQAPPPVPIAGTLREAWRLTRAYPRLVLLPMYAIQIPVAIVTAIVTLVLYLTVFRDEPVKTAADLFSDGVSGPLFASIVLTAFEALFAQVARGATIVGVAAAAEGRAPSLAALLDPAFSKMGGLLFLVLVQVAILVPGVVTVVGLPLALYALLRLDLATEAYLLDAPRPTQALSRSWTVLRGSLSRFLLTLLLAALVIVVPFVLVSSLSSMVVGGRTAQLVIVAVVTLVQSVLAAPILAFFTAVTTVFYLRVKVRQNARSAARI